jgi:hypothetical protein
VTHVPACFTGSESRGVDAVNAVNAVTPVIAVAAVIAPATGAVGRFVMFTLFGLPIVFFGICAHLADDGLDAVLRFDLVTPSYLFNPFQADPAS